MPDCSTFRAASVWRAAMWNSAWRVTLERFDTRALQERALEILKFKLDVLWQMSDAMALRYMGPPHEPACSSTPRRGPPSSAVSGCNGRPRKMRMCCCIPRE